jgi:methionyl-tRNA formyltransferase
MILGDIAMLAVPNGRSEAYLDRLHAADLTPSFALVLTGGQKVLTPGQRLSDLDGGFVGRLAERNIPHVLVPSLDINSPEVIGAVESRSEGHFIYSGPGGAILGRQLLGTGKKFIHVHPGRLPDFRGSTTVYYQLLASPAVGATAIFMEERIDQGPVLGAAEFPPPPPGEDLDYGFDPRVRAEVLARTLEAYVRDGGFRPAVQPAGGETYYIMHPVLRHIAKLKVENGNH